MSTPLLVKVRCRGESYSGVSNTTRKHVHASRIKQFQRLHYKTKFMTHPEKPPVIPVAEILKKIALVIRHLHPWCIALAYALLAQLTGYLPISSSMVHVVCIRLQSKRFYYSLMHHIRSPSGANFLIDEQYV
jgi:hypothetical protein